MVQVGTNHDNDAAGGDGFVAQLSSAEKRKRDRVLADAEIVTKDGAGALIAVQRRRAKDKARKQKARAAKPSPPAKKAKSKKTTPLTIAAHKQLRDKYAQKRAANAKKAAARKTAKKREPKVRRPWGWDDHGRFIGSGYPAKPATPNEYDKKEAAKYFERNPPKPIDEKADARANLYGAFKDLRGNHWTIKNDVEGFLEDNAESFDDTTWLAVRELMAAASKLDKVFELVGHAIERGEAKS